MGTQVKNENWPLHRFHSEWTKKTEWEILHILLCVFYFFLTAKLFVVEIIVKFARNKTG